MTTIKQRIGIKPLSINKAWQGRRFMTKEYKQWVKDALLLMGKQRELVGDVSVHLDFYVKYPKMCDIDNPVKTCLDLFKKRGWLKDDRQVTYLSVCKKQSEQERIEVEIKELDK